MPSDLPTYDDDGRLVLRHGEEIAFRCDTCDYVVAVSLSDPYVGVGLRCVECGEEMERIPDEETVDWREVNPDAYK